MDAAVASSLGRRDASRGGEGVMIAVLDTWPVQRLATSTRLQAANPLIDAAANGLLARVNNSYISTARPAVRPCGHVDHDETTWGLEDLADHGLFITSILRDIAPRAEIVVHRVFHNHGCTDHDAIARAVMTARDDAQQAGMPLVLNLSFGFGPHLGAFSRFLAQPDLPTTDWPGWIATLRGLSSRAARVSATSALNNQILDAIRAVFSVTGGMQPILGVAATGNDSGWKGQHLLPRLPAALRGVLGVSSFNPEPDPTPWRMDWYANDEDLLKGNDGIGAGGGNVLQPARDSAARRGALNDSVVGLSTAPMLWDGATGRDTPNHHGYACWSGTSFAAAIASGYAASIWSEARYLSAGQVRSRVLRSRPGGADREYLPFVQR